MDNTQEISLDGCYTLIGEIINRAVLDYRCLLRKIKSGKKLNTRDQNLFNEAKGYLFNPNNLEAYIKKFSLPCNIEAIRSHAKDLSVRERNI